MKEDILEQLVCDYFETKGYFTQCNVKFKPVASDEGYEPKQHGVHSDIDVLGYNPKLNGKDRVIAVSCKSWQEGFSPDWVINAISKKSNLGGREVWRSFRELVDIKWSRAFRKVVRDQTGVDEFVYYTAVTKLDKNANKKAWEENPDFKSMLPGCDIKLITLPEMVKSISDKMTKTVANSDLGRTIQLLKAAGMLNDSIR